MDLRFRFATPEDAPMLAKLNAQLIRDEGHRSELALPQLEQRMVDWLRGEYRVVVFEGVPGVVGYALYRREPEFVYLRQLFVVKDCRRQGVASRALAWLWQYAWRGAPRLRIDVLIENTSAQAFWRAVGFHEYCLTMEMAAPCLGKIS
jgi:GNAT superfamily N-acetyltransferase